MSARLESSGRRFMLSGVSVTWQAGYLFFFVSLTLKEKIGDAGGGIYIGAIVSSIAGTDFHVRNPTESA